MGVLAVHLRTIVGCVANLLQGCARDGRYNMSVAGCRGLTIRLLESAVRGRVTRNTMCHGDSWVRGCWLGWVGAGLGPMAVLCARGVVLHMSLRVQLLCLHLSVRGAWMCMAVWPCVQQSDPCARVLLHHLSRATHDVHSCSCPGACWVVVGVGGVDVQAHLAFVAVQQKAHRCRPACSFGASGYILRVLLWLASHTKAVDIYCVC